MVNIAIYLYIFNSYSIVDIQGNRDRPRGSPPGGDSGVGVARRIRA